MSEPNVIHVQSLYAAFARGDLDVIAKACADDVRWEVVGRPADFPPFGLRTGPAGVADFFKACLTAKSFLELTPRSFYPSGDRVFVEGHERSTVIATGREVDTEWLHVFCFQDGRVVAFREFYDTAQFVEAARG